jgi:YD repeat-containing protein
VLQKVKPRYKLSYSKNGLKYIKNEGTIITKYEYDTEGNVTSIICYTGQFKKHIYKPYLCIDSLEKYFDVDTAFL